MRNVIIARRTTTHPTSPTGTVEDDGALPKASVKAKGHAGKLTHALDFILMGQVGVAIAAAGITSIIMAVTH